MKLYACIILTVFATNAKAQVTPPCGNDYGTSADEDSIVLQMRYGNISDAINAINKAKNSRGTALGCPQMSLTYAAPNFSAPSLSNIENAWNTVHVPNISAFNVTCPRIGRYENNSALGAYYAMQAGYFNDSSKLAEIADMMYDQQYANWNFTSPTPRNEGVYACINTSNSDPCYPGGVVGASVTGICSNLPYYCVTYNGGQFSGINFLTSSQDDTNKWFDGGLAYDHGWAGVQMIESAIMQSDPTLKQKYRNSVALAGQYALSEYCVKNHNYTAKLIWLLAQLYAWTGDTIYRNELNYKLNKSLIPGILCDANNDGFVDDTSPLISFSSLTAVAQMPGRMWDGHNSLPWYHAMNAWALTEAYVAFRDRGDLARANQLKPYVVAMLDNLSNEIITQGVVTPDVLGVRDITYALLTGIWKIVQYENEAHANWEQAAWAMWNSGYFNVYSTHSVCVGLYLLVVSGTSYMPLHLRENYILSSSAAIEKKSIIKIFPNPANQALYIRADRGAHVPLDYVITDMPGRQVMSGIINSETSDVDISRLEKGQYIIKFFDKERFIQPLKFTRQ